MRVRRASYPLLRMGSLDSQPQLHDNSTRFQPSFKTTHDISKRETRRRRAGDLPFDLCLSAFLLVFKVLRSSHYQIRGHHRTATTTNLVGDFDVLPRFPELHWRPHWSNLNGLASSLEWKQLLRVDRQQGKCSLLCEDHSVQSGRIR